jgi:hypothetical protein
MSKFVPVSRELFESKFWKRNPDYAFAGKDSVAPLVLQELSKVCLSLPIAFIKNEAGFTPVAVQSFEASRNLLVAENGKWIGRYIPAVYRGYPFALATAGENQQVLCVDEEYPLINDEEGESFFNEDGPSQVLKDVLSFLDQVRVNRDVTMKACQSIEAADLFVPWDITIKSDTGDQNLAGLFRIDESKFIKLSIEGLDKIRNSGGLPVIYSHLLSVQHLQSLGALARQLNSLVKPDATNVDELFGESDDTLKFDFENI